ncbi:hypothetical protein CXG81DRAFT_19251 [Caulochytrium protostelioides]|uniref:Tubulin nucleotide-binding domain-like protein n=1 Tax=Caulochytrium protostelioides TaxID=1555241 RepID=A0A4P9X6R9_9FUNG|nr:hypothetical protein CXG81DRAFT_19251 [Caulochytrium protostelioides]|eukprot:RKP00894.1 hypothetical protein CXG81DRAFT_19251 [Caulochytrium protostelioides]
MAREIITLQVGHAANWVGTHYWNQQQTLLSQGAYDARGDRTSTFRDLPDPDTLFRQGQSAAGETTYLPRLLLLDTRDSYHTLKLRNALYDPATAAAGAAAAPAVATWHGPVQHVREPAYRKNPYLQSLDAEEVAYQQQQQQQQPQSASEFAAAADPVNPDVDHLQVWSDFNSLYYHPKTTLAVPTYTMDLDMAPLAAYGQGAALLTDTEYTEFADELIEDRLRFFLEESDHVQGFQMAADTATGWSGLATGIVAHLADELPKVPVWILGLEQGWSWPHQPTWTALPQHEQQRLRRWEPLNVALTWAALARHRDHGHLVYLPTRFDAVDLTPRSAPLDPRPDAPWFSTGLGAPYAAGAAGTGPLYYASAALAMTWHAASQVYLTHAAMGAATDRVNPGGRFPFAELTTALSLAPESPAATGPAAETAAWARGVLAKRPKHHPRGWIQSYCGDPEAPASSASASRRPTRHAHVAGDDGGVDDDDDNGGDGDGDGDAIRAAADRFETCAAGRVAALRAPCFASPWQAPMPAAWVAAWDAWLTHTRCRYAASASYPGTPGWVLAAPFPAGLVRASIATRPPFVDVNGAQAAFRGVGAGAAVQTLPTAAAAPALAFGASVSVMAQVASSSTMAQWLAVHRAALRSERREAAWVLEGAAGDAMTATGRGSSESIDALTELDEGLVAAIEAYHELE